MDERLLNRDIQDVRDQPMKMRDPGAINGIKMTSNKRILSIGKRKLFKLNSCKLQGKPDPIPMICDRLNEHFDENKKQNPKGYLDSFEMQA